MEIMGIDITYIFIGVFILISILLILYIILLIKYGILNKKYKNFMKGREGNNLEEVIFKRFDEIDFIKTENKRINYDIANIKEILNNTYQKVGIVKYDAFKELGGRLSFSLAILNNKNTGYVMNSVHNREGCYTYVKEIIKGESAIELSKEEAEAIKIAINS